MSIILSFFLLLHLKSSNPNKFSNEFFWFLTLERNLEKNFENYEPMQNHIKMVEPFYSKIKEHLIRFLVRFLFKNLSKKI